MLRQGLLIKKLRRAGKSIPVLLLLLFLWHQGGSFLFQHTHIVGGQIVVHSHPYAGDKEQPRHTHTLFQFVSIAQAALAMTPDPAAEAPQPPAMLFAAPCVYAGELHWFDFPAFHYTLRGPPAC